MTASIAAGGARERLLAFVRPWLATPPGGARLAAVSADFNAWVAVLRDAHGSERVLVSTHGAVLEDDARLLDMLRQVERGTTCAFTRLQVRAARQGIRRWLRSEASATLTRAHASGSGSRAVIMRRLDEALRTAPINGRAVLASRIAAARTRISHLRGVGAERALATAAKCATVQDLLDAVDAIRRPPDDNRPAARGVRLLALLLLVADERGGATVRPPTPCSPRAAACSGTAAPR